MSFRVNSSFIYSVGCTDEINLEPLNKPEQYNEFNPAPVRKVRVEGADSIILDDEHEYNIEDIKTDVAPISIDPINIKPIKLGGEKE